MRLKTTLALLALACALPARPAPPQPEATQLQGRYDLWQDGDGGPLCHVTLGGTPTLGGQALRADADCARKLGLAGDPYAWFMAPDGRLVIIDAARQPLLRMERVGDPRQREFKDRRAGDYNNAVLLTPATPITTK